MQEKHTTVRMPQELWDAAEARRKRDGERSIACVIRLALEAYINQEVK